jgi:hypothetical protein
MRIPVFFGQWISVHILSALILQLLPALSGASGNVDLLPKNYLPPENLAIQESVDQVLDGLDAMGTYGELHRTLKVFRPDSDHKILTTIFKSLESEPLPKIRTNGLTLDIDIPTQGTVALEVVNLQKARFRVQGTPYVFQIRKPFAETLTELRALIYKPKKVSKFNFSIFSMAWAQKSPTVAFIHEARIGAIMNQVACADDVICLAVIKNQQRRAPTLTSPRGKNRPGL